MKREEEKKKEHREWKEENRTLQRALKIKEATRPGGGGEAVEAI